MQGKPALVTFVKKCEFSSVNLYRHKPSFYHAFTLGMHNIVYIHVPVPVYEHVLFLDQAYLQQAMQNPALHPVTATKQTVDSRDKLAQSLCALLGELSLCIPYMNNS